MLRLMTLALAAVTAHPAPAAEIVKILRNRAVLNVMPVERPESLHPGDRVYLVDGFGNHSPMDLEKIDGQQMIFKGKVDKLEKGLKYDLSLAQSSEEGPPQSYSSPKKPLGLRSSLSLGKRWTSHEAGGIHSERVLELALGGKLPELPLGFYGYVWGTPSPLQRPAHHLWLGCLAFQQIMIEISKIKRFGCSRFIKTVASAGKASGGTLGLGSGACRKKLPC